MKITYTTQLVLWRNQTLSWLVLTFDHLMSKSDVCQVIADNYPDWECDHYDWLAAVPSTNRIYIWNHYFDPLPDLKCEHWVLKR